MTASDRDLDVVVLGGSGHVGLPLSLAFAEAGLRVGIYDTNAATLDRIAAGDMPFRESGAQLRARPRAYGQGHDRRAPGRRASHHLA